MNKKTFYSLLIFIALLITISIVAFYNNPEDPFELKVENEEEYTAINQKGLNLMKEEEFLSDSTEGIMLMIEFGEDSLGLTNFVDNLEKRDISSLLLVSPDYINENCATINKLMDLGVKLGAGINSKPFWDVPYKEQYELMQETISTVKACTGEDLKMFNSRYFAYDENTLKAAEELGIEYVFARGTTGQRVTIYKPEEYDVKIFSVSNINSPEYGTGSLCDYSYWARSGTPDEFGDQLFDALKFDKISPVTHAYIGGLKKQWNDSYLDFFDNTDVQWKSLEEFAGQPDLILPYDQIPQNREVQYVDPKPSTPLEEEENVENPCAAEDLSQKENQREDQIELESNDKPVVFHNNKGEMCLEMIEYFKENNYEFTEHLTTDEDFSEKLNQYKNKFNQSEGVSDSFGYYPMIFINDQAFSGFNFEIADKLKQIIED
jgi:hypothetical protein